LPVTELCPDHPELRERLEAAIAERRQNAPESQAETLASDQSPHRSVVLPDLNDRRYVADRFYARGGLGEVFIAVDSEVGREVALKRIRPAAAESPGARDRFVREARLTGRLEHPGIVPVYGVGRDAAGEPFYAMRFIRGQSLRQAIDAYYAAPPPNRELAFRQLLQRFVAACNAVAFSHSHGVLHRDLKPANIMLGPFGETLVVDWGLAKHVDESESQIIRALRPSLAESAGSDDPTDSLTVAGSALGTPAFMSPEQASGQWTEVGPAADVFALGATLYYLLTGQSPYGGTNALAQAQEGLFTPPRRIRPTVPPALEAICLKAMQPQPADRYSSAMELANEIEQWLADEPVQAYAEPWRDRARRWVRRHRGAVTLMLGILATGIVALTVTAILLRRAQSQTEIAYQQSQAILDRMLARVGDDEAWLRQSPQVNRLRLRLLREALGGYREIHANQPEDAELRRELARTLRRTGDAAAELGLFDDARRDLDEAEATFRDLRLAASGDELSTRDLAECLNSEGNLASDSGKLAVAESKHREALELREQLSNGNSNRPDLRRDIARSWNNLANVTRQLGPSRHRDTEQSYRQAVTICRDLVQLTDGPAPDRRLLALALNNLGLFLRDTDRPVEARRDLMESLQLRQGLAAESPENPDYRNDVAGTLGNIAQAELRAGDFAAALKTLEQATPHHEAALKANPDHPTYRLFRRNNLAWHGIAAARIGNHALAAQEAERVAVMNASTALDPAFAAAIFLHCAAAVQTDSAIPERDRVEHSRRYRERAKQWVANAKSQGLEPASVRGDFCLAVLLEDPALRALIESSESK
jgi:tetratricopeptide (TPR) repeat protein/tRNA A-37 threonylcarbamoyl transferase component Bud32